MVSSEPADLWDEMLREHLRRLQRRNTTRLPLQSLEYKSFQATLESLDETARRAKVPEYIFRLRPALKHLDIFTSAINSLAQTKSNPLGFIWGSIQAVLACAVQYASTLEMMTDMLDDLTRTLTRFNRYLNLLSDNAELRGYLRLLYNDFVGFCVSALLFYKSVSWYTVVKMLWSTMKESFQSTKENIQKHIKNFEEEARTSIDELTVKGITEIRSRLLSPLTEVSDGPKVVYSVPFSRNDFFVGRERELLQMHGILTYNYPNGDQRRNVCVIHSMGGVGKTQLAREYVARYRSVYAYIFWLAAERGPGLAQNFASIGKLTSFKQPAVDEPVSLMKHTEIARSWLEATSTKWLLVYDNAQDWDTIKPYWPNSEHGSIIITTQRLDLTQVSGHSSIALQPLDPGDGATLLLRHLRCSEGDVSAEDFHEALCISKVLGGLPVGISHMAGYISKSQSTLVEFSAMYKQRDQTQRIWSHNCRAWTYQYDRSLDTVWDIALAELPPAARALINVLAMLDPDQISEKMIFGAVDASVFNPESKELLISLQDRQLVHREAPALSGKAIWSIHRALQLNILHRLDNHPEVRQGAFNEALTVVRQVYPRQSEIQAPSNDKWRAYDIGLPHALQLQVVFECSNPPLEASSAFLELLSDAGNFMWERALYEQGIKTLELAESIYERQGGVDLIEKSKVLTLLGVLSQEVGLSGRKKGLDRIAKSLVLRRRYFKEIELAVSRVSYIENLLLANAWNDLACSMLEHSSYGQAEIYLKMSIDLKVGWNMPETGDAFFNYAENYKNLAIVRIAQRRFQEAVNLTTRAVELMERGFGCQGAAVQAFRFHRAYAIYYSGDLSSALEAHQAVREARVRIFGQDEVHTLNSYYACAVVLQALQRLDKAEALLRECLSENYRGHWTVECIIRAKYRLASVLNEKDPLEAEASWLLQEARDMRGKLTEYHKPFWAIDGPEIEESVDYDHLVSFEAGRCSIGQLRIHHVEVDVGDFPDKGNIPSTTRGSANQN